MDYLGYMSPEEIGNIFMLVFAGGLEGRLTSTVGEFRIGAMAYQRFDRFQATPGGGIEERSGPGLLVAGIDFGALIQQQLYHFGIAAEGCVVQWCRPRFIPDANLCAMGDQ